MNAKEWNTTSNSQLVAQAQEGVLGQAQKRIAEVGLDWLTTLINKNIDYGSSVWERPILAPDLPPKVAIRVRMTDKIRRLQQLLKNGEAKVTTESFEDTIKDLGAYCLLYLAAPEEEESNDADTHQETKQVTANQGALREAINKGFLTAEKGIFDDYPIRSGQTDRT